MLITLGDLISRTLKLYKGNLKLFLTYALLLVVPSIVTFAAVALGGFGGLLLTVSTKSQMTGLGGGVLIMLLLIAAAVLLSFWFMMAFIRVIAARYQEAAAGTVREELRAARPLIGSAILASLLAGLAVLGGLILFIVPGIIFAIWLAFAVYAVALDHKPATNALGASKQLVQRRWWSVFARIIVPILLSLTASGMITSIVSAPLNWLIPAGPRGELPPMTLGMAAGFIGSYAVSFAINIFFSSLITCAMTILYIELKKMPTRTETGK